MAFSPAQVEQLLRPVNPRRVQKDNHGMSHLAAYDVSAHLTRIFGFGGWSKHVLSLELVAEDAVPDQSRNGRFGWWVTYRCTMRLEVGDWSNEDGATGSASNLPDRGDAHDFALKNAISYALKRCAKDLGDQFGLSLYNKGSTAALIGRTLTGSPPQAFTDFPPSGVDQDVPDLAPDWDEQPPGRADGLPTNRDGSLSRSRTTDAEKASAGVMTSAQHAEHTALQPKRGEMTGKVTRLHGPAPGDQWSEPASGAPTQTSRKSAPATAGGSKCGECGVIGGHSAFCSLHPEDIPTEERPGSILARQRSQIMAKLGKLSHDDRAAELTRIVGRKVESTNDLSIVEAEQVIKS